MGEIKATESRFNQTVQKDQATLIAELISRVTSLEDAVESILEQLQVNTTENTDEIQPKPTATTSLVTIYDKEGYISRRYEI